MKEKKCVSQREGWKELVFSRMHINCNPDSLQRLSELGGVTDVSLGRSASDHLSERRLSRVCMVTMSLMNFVWVHSPGRDLLPTDLLSCDLVLLKHILPHS